MQRESRVPAEALLLVVAIGVATTARAMTLSFLAIVLQQKFGLGPAMIGFLLRLGSLMGAIAAPFVGALSDKVGRMTVLTSAIAALAVTMFALAIAEAVLLFCVAQSLASIAISIFGPISRALISDICPEPLRLKCFSWRHIASNIGWAVGPLIGVAAGVASTPLFLVASGIYTALAFILQFMRFIPAIPERGSPAAEAASMTDGLKAAMGDRRLSCFIGGSTLLVAVYGQWTATLAPYLIGNVSGGVEIFAYIVSINGAVVIVGSPIARRVVEWIGPAAALFAGCALLVLSQLGFNVSAGASGYVISVVVFTIGEILVVPSEYVFVDRISTTQSRGSYFGAHSILSIGSFLGPVLGGIVHGTLGSPAMFFLFAGFSVGGMLLFAMGIHRRE
jgi:MFS family permease